MLSPRLQLSAAILSALSMFACARAQTPEAPEAPEAPTPDSAAPARDSAAPARDSAAPARKAAPEQSAAGTVQGMTISTHGSGRDWGTDIMPETMKDIAATGANWVATHPYAWIRRDGRVEFREFVPDAPPAHIVRPIGDAHAEGLKIMVKPHIGYWGSGFSWRGAIDFEKAEERQRFFDTYRKWIVAVAAASKGADAFAVGTELDKLLDEAQWRRIIQEIREVTDAKLTYAANWTDYQRVEFWDALDVVGIQAYFPIAKKPTAEADVLRAGWRERMAELRRYSQDVDRHIVFTELGYNRAFDTAVEPWAADMDGAEAVATQAICFQVALAAVAAEPRIVGSFLWKWFPGTSHFRHHDFQLQDPTIRATIEAAWRK